MKNSNLEISALTGKIYLISGNKREDVTRKVLSLASAHYQSELDAGGYKTVSTRFETTPKSNKYEVLIGTKLTKSELDDVLDYIYQLIENRGPEND